MADRTERARELRREATEAERVLWGALRNRQLDGHKFRRQTPIGPFIVDFVCMERRLIVEVDGGQHDERREYDEERSAALMSEGFRVVRYWNSEVLSDVEAVADSILLELGGPSP